MLSNLSARPMEVTLCGVSGRVHEGMMAAATYVHCSTAPALAAAAAAHPGWPILCVGHSMGGGVATILTALLRDGVGVPGLGNVSCIAIGPAAVFNETLAAALKDHVTSVVLGADAVPRLSLASVEAALAELAAASPVRVAAAELKRAVGTAAAGAAEVLAAAGAELRDIVSTVGAMAGGVSGGGSGGGSAASPPAGLSSLPRIAASDDGGVAAAAAAAMVRAAANEVELVDLSPRELAGEEGSGVEGSDDVTTTTPMPTPSPADAAAMATRSQALMEAEGGVMDVSPTTAAAATAAAAAADAAVLASSTSPPRHPPSAEFDAAALHADRTEPLLVAGTLLWVLPPGDLAAAAGGPAAPDAAAAAASAAARPPVAPDGGDLDAVVAATTDAGAVSGRVPRATAAPVAQTCTPPPCGALVLAAPRAAFGRILLTPDAVQDHLPDAYVAALERL